MTMSKALQRHKSYNVLIDLPLWLSVALLTLLYGNALPLLPLFLLSYAVARILPDHPPTLLRTWLLYRGWSIPSARSRSCRFTGGLTRRRKLHDPSRTGPLGAGVPQHDILGRHQGHCRRRHLTEANTHSFCRGGRVPGPQAGAGGRKTRRASSGMAAISTGPCIAGGRAGRRRTVTVGRRPAGPATVKSIPALGRELQAALPPSTEAGGYPGPLAISIRLLFAGDATVAATCPVRASSPMALGGAAAAGEVADDVDGPGLAAATDAAPPRRTPGLALTAAEGVHGSEPILLSCPRARPGGLPLLAVLRRRPALPMYACPCVPWPPPIIDHARLVRTPARRVPPV